MPRRVLRERVELSLAAELHEVERQCKQQLVVVAGEDFREQLIRLRVAPLSSCALRSGQQDDALDLGVSPSLALARHRLPGVGGRLLQAALREQRQRSDRQYRPQLVADDVGASLEEAVCQRDRMLEVAAEEAVVDELGVVPGERAREAVPLTQGSCLVDSLGALGEPADLPE